MQAKATFSDYFQLHFIIFIWGFTAILGKLIESISAVELVFHRTFLAFILLFFVTKYRKKPLRLDTESSLKILGTGTLIGLHWILFFLAIHISNVSICLVGMATTSLWTSILEPMFTKKKIQWFEIFLGVFIVLGLCIIIITGNNSDVETGQGFGFMQFLGLLLGIFSAFLGALFSVLNATLIKNHNHYTITFYEMIGACLVSVVSIPLFHTFVLNTSPTLIPQGLEWLYIIILAGVCTVFAYTLSVKLMHKFTPFAINLTINLEPVYGILLAFMFFNEERMNVGFYIGTHIILLAVITYPYLNKYFTKIRPQKKMDKLEALETVKVSDKEVIF